MIAFFRAVTVLGGTEVVLVGAALIAIFLLFRRMRRQAAFVALVVLGTQLSVFIIKRLVALPRPPETLYEVAVSGFSFPSGHAAAAAALYGALWYLVFNRLESFTARAVWTAFAVFVIVLVAVSRVALGVHFPADVLAGVAIAAAWLVAGVGFLRFKGASFHKQ